MSDGVFYAVCDIGLRRGGYFLYNIIIIIINMGGVNYNIIIKIISFIPYLCVFEENLCKITEPRKQKLKVEILHNLKEF